MSVSRGIKETNLDETIIHIVYDFAATREELAKHVIGSLNEIGKFYILKLMSVFDFEKRENWQDPENMVNEGRGKWVPEEEIFLRHRFWLWQEREVPHMVSTWSF
ncbi:hypothetical protein Adt_34030 [Abeliophyllum distichum]|uniref:Uncharacterized protein n=1 Tax=Abeliophyllum distichum TaxID=126358 RepID=A0ABD1QYY4_9LAMI